MLVPTIMSCGLPEFNTRAFPGVFPHVHLVHRLCSVCFLICTQYTGFDRCVSSALSTQAFAQCVPLGNT